MAEKTEEEIMRQDPLLLTRNLLRIAIYNISYIRGLFPEKYFNDKSVPALGMKIKKLMPIDAESRRLIDWMEQGVCDALQKKYLKTLLFCICEKEEGSVTEEFAFSFSYPNSSGEEVTMRLSRTGSKENGSTFKSNAEITPDEMRNSVLKMIRTCGSLIRTLDQMTEERSIMMKLMYYDDVTPEDYEPPFFKCCADNEAINKWNMNSLEMQVSSLLDPYNDSNISSEDDNASIENEHNQDEDSSETEVYLAKSFGRLCCVSKRGPLLYLDSGATHHIWGDRSYMKDMRPIKEQKQKDLYSVKGKLLRAKEIGSIAYGSIQLSEVPFIPSVPFNLLSIGQLDKQGLLISISDGQFSITDVKNSILVGEGYRHVKNNDYVVRGINWVLPLVDKENSEDQSDGEDCQDNDMAVTELDEEEEDDQIWVIDSCCPCHMASKLEMLTNRTRSKQVFHTPKGTMKATYRGVVKNEMVNLSDVLHCPENKNNLLSVAVLDRQGYRFTFYNGMCRIVCKETLREVGFGQMDEGNNLYYLQSLGSCERNDLKFKRKRK